MLDRSHRIRSAHDQGTRRGLQGKRRPQRRVTNRRKRHVSPPLLNLVTGHGERREELLSRHAQTNQEESGLVQALSRRGARHLPRLVTFSDLIMNQTLASRN